MNASWIVLFFVIFVAPGEVTAQTKKIVFGYSTVGAMAAGSWMAKEIGAYEKYGTTPI